MTSTSRPTATYSRPSSPCSPTARPWDPRHRPRPDEGPGRAEGELPQYLTELMEITPTAANVLEYAAIVRDRALLRALAQVGEDITNMVYEGSGQADTMLENAERKIYALSRDRQHRRPYARCQRRTAGVRRHQRSRLERERHPRPLHPACRISTHAILGLNGGDFALIAARPGMGQDQHRAEHSALRRQDKRQDSRRLFPSK